MKENSQTLVENDKPKISGVLSRRPLFAPLRVVATMTGLILLSNVVTLVARYCLRLTTQAHATIYGSSLTIETELSLFGKEIRRTRITAPLNSTGAVSLENRQRYLHLLVGFGCLVVGALVGIQWFVDGLRAGFHYLTLVGAGIVAAGVIIDLLLYVFVPAGKGRCHVLLTAGPWIFRLKGVDHVAADSFFKAAQKQWSSFKP
jgi:hypothetical protein